MSFVPIIPFPKDICSLVPTGAGLTGAAKTAAEIAYATCQNLANELITPNEVYNAYTNTTAVAQQFISGIDAPGFIYDVLIGYTKRVLPYLYGTLTFIFLFIMIFLMMTSKVDIFFGLWLIITFVFVMAVVLVYQADSVTEFLQERKDAFISLVDSEWAQFKTDALATILSGYVAGSSMTINGPTGPISATGSRGPGIIPISNTYIEPLLNPLTDSYNLYPYSKLTILSTPDSTSVNDIYDVNLFETRPIDVNSASLQQMIKPSYPKIIYITNLGKNTTNPSIGTGKIRIVNAASLVNLNNNASTISLFNYNNQGTPLGQINPSYILPGQTKGYINVSYSNPFGGLVPNPYLNISLSTCNWVEIS